MWTVEKAREDSVFGDSLPNFGCKTDGATRFVCVQWGCESLTLIMSRELQLGSRNHKNQDKKILPCIRGQTVTATPRPWPIWHFRSLFLGLGALWHYGSPPNITLPSGSIFVLLDCQFHENKINY